MPHIQIPGYKILSQLGKGGMSSVYLAEQLSFGRPVALKVMTANLAETEHFGHRFLREARIAAHLSHPNIVSVYDTGYVDGNYFLAMEYLPGEDLKRRIESGIALLEGLDIVIALADAIDYASAAGVIHRDIKPANIMFREDGSLAVVDFGIARDISTETKVTQIGTVMGTPHYMSPEQSAAEELDSRSDLYSVGIVFYELLSGHVPFRADSAAAVGVQHISAPVPPLPEQTRIFQDIINRVLAKNPDERYQTGMEFASDIEELRRDLPEELETTILLSKLTVAERGSNSSRMSGHRSRRRKLMAHQRRQKAPVSARTIAIGVAVSTLILGGLFYQYVWPEYIAETEQVDTIKTAGRFSAESGVKSADAPTSLASNNHAIIEEQSRIDTLAALYIDRARNSLSDGLIDSAVSYIEMAQSLEPNAIEIREALAEVIAGSEQLRNERRQLENLVKTYENELADKAFYNPLPANAYLTLNEISQLAPQYPQLSAMRTQLDAAAQRSIGQLMSQGELDRAANEIELLSKVAPVELVDQLERKLADLEGKKKADSLRLQQIREEVLSLKVQAKKFETDTRELIAIYQKILWLDASDSVARGGLDTVLAAEMETARRAMQAGQLTQARNIVDYLSSQGSGQESLVVTSTELERLESRRRRAEAEQRAAVGILEKVESSARSSELSPAVHIKQAGELIRAYQAIYQAQQQDPTLSGIDTVLDRIDQEYTERFSAHDNGDGMEIASIYAEALSASSLSAPHILEMQEEFNTALESIAEKRRRSFSSF